MKTKRTTEKYLKIQIAALWFCAILGASGALFVLIFDLIYPNSLTKETLPVFLAIVAFCVAAASFYNTDLQILKLKQALEKKE